MRPGSCSVLSEDIEDMNRECAEAHLRRLAEAELRRVPALPTDNTVSHRLALVAQALVAVGAIDVGTTEQIQAEVDLALTLRQAGSSDAASPDPGVAIQARLDGLAQVQLDQAARAFPVSGPSAWHPASRRIVPVGRVIQISDADLHSELHLLTYAHTPDGARFTVAIGTRKSSGLHGSRGRLCRPPQRRPRQFTATDDQGITYLLSFRAGSRTGVIELDPDPPQEIRWLDLTTTPGEPAIRIELDPPDPPVPAPAVIVTRKAKSPGELLLEVIAARLLTVAVTFPQDTSEQLAAARRELLWLAAEDRLGHIITALQAAGALPAASPVPSQLAGLCARLGVSGHGITAPPADDLPEPWESMLTRYHCREPYPALAAGSWATAVVELPEQDGAKIAILDLHHSEPGTILHMLVSGVTTENDWPYSRVVRPLPVLWIQDSSARWHTTQAYGTGRPGGNGEVVLWLDIKPPLERGTTWVDVVAAGQLAEVRARLPLRWR
jgi:hypothetical protein